MLIFSHFYAPKNKIMTVVSCHGAVNLFEQQRALYNNIQGIKRRRTYSRFAFKCTSCVIMKI